METNSSGGEEPVHFISQSQPLSEAVIRGVAYVKGVDPVELEPLSRVVDPDALDTIFTQTETGTITFELDGLTVQVTASGDVYVQNRETSRDNCRSLHDNLQSSSNILLLAEPHEHEVCTDLLSPVPFEEETVLGVTLAQSVEDRLRIWKSYAGDTPTYGAIITVGEFTRSASESATIPLFPSSSFTVKSVPSIEDLSELGIRITDRLSVDGDIGKECVACFHSITELLRELDEERVFRFLHILTGQMRQSDVLAHYHLDPTAHDEATIEKFRTLFDTVIKIDCNGNWVIES